MDGIRGTAALAVVALLGVACEPSSEPRGKVTPGSATGDATEVVVDDGRSQTDTLELEAGEEVTVEVRNEDGTAHDFAIDVIDLNTGTIEPGEVATATFTVPQGTTEFVCTFHGGMTGVIKT